MLNTLKRFALVGLILGCASVASAQTVLSNTTLSAAVNNQTRTFAIASASASAQATVGAPAAGQWLYVDLEAMLINSISGTTVTVTRGVGGTATGAHAASAVVFTGPAGAFQSRDPQQRVCTIPTMGYRPTINVQNGNVWFCLSGLWVASNVQNIVYNSNTPY